MYTYHVVGYALEPSIVAVFVLLYNKGNMTKVKLNLKQKTFCELFASDREFFGNGTQSYIEAYGIDLSKKGAYNVAKANANRLLTNADILTYIDELFEARGLNDTFVDKQLEKLITQDAEFNVKIKAITEYNKLKGRIIQKQEVTLVEPPKPLEDLTVPKE